MSSSDIDQFLNFAEALVDAVKPTIMSQFRSNFRVDTKDDTTPVTETDRAAELMLRQMIETRYPNHGILGEEFGIKRPDADFVWVIDPIDGTKSFICGKPTFGILIALIHRQRPILGVIDIPASGDRWVGALNRKTKFNDMDASVRSCNKLSLAWLCATSHIMFTPKNYKKFCLLENSCSNIILGTDCMGYGLLASGWGGLVCEGTLAIYDFAAHIPIIEGAGGAIRDWDGAPLKLDLTQNEKCFSVIASGDISLLKSVVSILND